MPAKDTAQLENELVEADNMKKFLDDNEENFRRFTLAEYLRRLLVEKKLSKAQVIKNSQLDEGYAHHIFGGRKNPSREKILSLALAMELSPKEADYLLFMRGIIGYMFVTSGTPCLPLLWRITKRFCRRTNFWRS